jgi:hypothetical protein
MANITWITEKGNIGLFPSNSELSYNLIAESTIDGMTLQYKLLNGQLPIGTNDKPITFSTTGQLNGIPKIVDVETNYIFTVRAYDALGNISDRTFSIKINNAQIVNIITPSGTLFSTDDSVYIDYQIDVYNPITSNNYRLVISSGDLPAGLQMSEQGRITGYCAPPFSVTGAPTIKTISFTVQLTSDLGFDTKTYSIIVANHTVSNPANTRTPVILNNKPLVLPVDPTDNYFGYYTNITNTLPVAQSNNYFSFKVIGYNFDNDSITYQYSILPPGLSGNPNTGWITGTPTIPNNSISNYKFSVIVAKTNIPTIKSQPETFSLTISNNMVQDVQWVTDNNLGNIDNGSKCELYLEASSVHSLNYRVVSGSLPPNVSLLTNGQLTGTIPFQANSEGLMQLGDTVSFNFTISAYNEQFPILSSEREFTLTVYQKYDKPLENIYFKASPSILGRQIIQSLLTDETLIPTEYLYRPDDNNFGKAENVKFVHIYGIESANIQTYLDAITYNHYYRKLILGEIKTAVARDDNGTIIYEVVYSEIIDPLIRPDGVALPQRIIWPTKIPLDEGPWYTAETNINISTSNIFTSYDYGTIRTLYPGSITNMRTELLANMNNNTNQDLLPKWMTSQQVNGNTLGFINAWVICYTLPNYSTTIKNNINNNWQYKLNIIDFSVDRLLVDKSTTYNYNTNLTVPSWTELPSNTPTPDPEDTYDIAVLFQQKTILPKNVDY